MRTSASDSGTSRSARLRELRDRNRRFFEGSVAARWALAIGLFLVALVFLVFLSWLLRGAGLWGDLAFAILITTGVFWIVRRLLQNLLDEGPFRALFRAFATTIFVLVGVPVAYVTRPWGLVLLFVPMLVWGAFLLAPKLGWRPSWRPVFWQAETAGVLLLGIVLLVAPAVGSANHVPKAVPPANVEGGELDAAITERFRPLLFFDSAEPRFPLDIEDAFESRRVRMCRKAVGDDSCETVLDPASVDENLDYLIVDEPSGTPPGGDDKSAVYAHVVRNEGRVYVDYWWFYSRNPSPVAGKVFCGPGLRTPPFTCQEHVGDWEGLTVVLGPCTRGTKDCQAFDGELLSPEEVRYGQHEHVAAYDWDGVLKPFWGAMKAPTSPALAETWESVVLPAVGRAGVRPIAFVARNSHASYPAPCFRECSQQTRALPEGVHDGALPWGQNGTCRECAKVFPLTAEGEPALWNAFPGHWGEQNCILAGAYCDLSGAPKGPSSQGRYDEPYSDEVVQICLTPADPPRLRRCPRAS